MRYIEILRLELERRQSQRPGYSMRRFADYLDLEASMICRVLKRKQYLSASAAAKILVRLELSGELAREFIESVAEAEKEKFLQKLHSYLAP